MSGSRIAKRYAKAFFNLVQSKSVDAGPCQDALDSAASLFELPDVKRILTSPVMPQDVKLAVIGVALDKAKAVEDVRRAFELIVEAGRVSVIPELATAFGRLISEAHGIVTANIRAAVPLEDKQQQELKKTLEEKFSKKVDLEVSVDPTIGAGLWIGVGNTVIDLTLRTRLDALVHNATR